MTMAAHLGLQSWEASIPYFDKTPIYVPANYSGLRAMIPRFFGWQVSVVEKKCFGQTTRSIKSKSVCSCRNQLRVLPKVQCVTSIAVMLCSITLVPLYPRHRLLAVESNMEIRTELLCSTSGHELERTIWL
jgi:hypothetical protein